MARKIAGKVIAKISLVAQTPLSIGGLGDESVDLPIAINGKGESYVPGSALSGPLRCWAERRLNEDVVKCVFGFQENDSGHASWLTVGDGKVSLPDGALIELRDGIGIERTTGTAAHGIKFERQVLPKGALISFDLELDLPKDDQPFTADGGKALLAFLLKALEDGDICLGAAKTRGLGRVKAESNSPPKVGIYNFAGEDRAAQLCRWLRKPLTPNAAAQDYRKELSFPTDIAPWRCITAMVTLKPSAPIMVKSGAAGVDVDMLPLVGQLGNNIVAAVLPGSSLKGALRSHAERIVRTLIGYPASADEFDKQLDVPIVRELFGSKSAAGWLSVLDVYQETRVLPLADWRSESFSTWGEREDHVAIDRFTGGAADGALFSLHTPPHEGWADLKFELELPKTRHQCEDAAIALFLLCLRDLAHDMIPVGFGSNRGLGAIQVASVSIESPDATVLPSKLQIKPTQGGMGGIEGLDEGRARELLESLRTILSQSAPSAAKEATDASH